MSSDESMASENILEENECSDHSHSFSHVNDVIGPLKERKRAFDVTSTSRGWSSRSLNFSTVSVGKPSCSRPTSTETTCTSAESTRIGKGFLKQGSRNLDTFRKEHDDRSYMYVAETPNRTPTVQTFGGNKKRPRVSASSTPYIRDYDEVIEDPVNALTSTPMLQVFRRNDPDIKVVLEAVDKVDKKITHLTETNLKLAQTQKQIMAIQEEILKRLNGNSTSGRKSNKVDVPGHIRTAVRDGFLSGIKRGLNWTERGGSSSTYLKPNSTENTDMTSYIDSYVEGMYPTSEAGVRKAGIERYFESFKQKIQRQNSGRDAAHKTKMVQYERKKRKRDRRLEAVKSKKSWSQEKKDLVTESLKMDYMSSEYEHDSDGECFFEVKPLEWRSDEYIKTLTELDTKHVHSQTARSKRQQVKRVVGEPSGRVAPAHVPESDIWVLNQRSPESGTQSPAIQAVSLDHSADALPQK